MIGCGVNGHWDYLTTYSGFVFLFSLILYFGLKPSLLEQWWCIGIIWFAIANAVAVGIVGHIAVSYVNPPNERALNAGEVTRLRIIDDLLHIAPLIFWLVICVADFQRICGGVASGLWALTLYAAFNITYLSIPVTAKDDSRCPSGQSSFLDKMKLVYGQLQHQTGWMVVSAGVIAGTTILVLTVASTKVKVLKTQRRPVIGLLIVVILLLLAALGFSIR
jgi:hypothetical protein